ncbi:hypothetical protein [Metarhizobium album]|uniref:hypothetical protein n=1 Tax=Metarhizobium album TaxID=2182425 RepID=UPI000FFE81F6|nr:hypothetical protein [Rhizobium album]
MKTLQSNVLDGALNEDKAIIDNKLVASDLFTRNLDTSEEQALYAGPIAAGMGRQFLEPVTKDPSTVPTLPQVNAFIATLPQGGTGQPAGTLSVQQVLDGAANGSHYILADRLDKIVANPDVMKNADSYQLTNSIGGVGAVTVEGAKVLLGAKNASSFDYSLADTDAAIKGAAASVIKEADTIAVVGTEQGDTLNYSGFGRGVILSGNGGDDTLMGTQYNDNLIGGTGRNTYLPGSGKDTITLTSGDSVETIRIDTTGLGGDLNTKNTLVYIQGFDKADKFAISNADVFTDTGPTFDITDIHFAPWTNPTLANYTGLHGSQGFDQITGSLIDSDTIAVYILPKLNATGSELDKVADGSLLMQGLGAGTARAYADIRADWSGYLVAYQNGNGYVYWADDANSDGKLVASEISLKVKLMGVAENILSADNFVLS